MPALLLSHLCNMKLRHLGFVYFSCNNQRKSERHTDKWTMCERDHGILLEARHPLHHSLQQHTEETGKREKERERVREINRKTEDAGGGPGGGGRAVLAQKESL